MNTFFTDLLWGPLFEDFTNKRPPRVISRTKLSHGSAVRMSYGEQTTEIDCFPRVFKKMFEIVLAGDGGEDFYKNEKWTVDYQCRKSDK